MIKFRWAKNTEKMKAVSVLTHSDSGRPELISPMQLWMSTKLRSHTNPIESVFVPLRLSCNRKPLAEVFFFVLSKLTQPFNENLTSTTYNSTFTDIHFTMLLLTLNKQANYFLMVRITSAWNVDASINAIYIVDIGRSRWHIHGLVSGCSPTTVWMRGTILGTNVGFSLHYSSTKSLSIFWRYTNDILPKKITSQFDTWLVIKCGQESLAKLKCCIWCIIR